MLADDALLLFVPLILSVLLIALLVDCVEARKKPKRSSRSAILMNTTNAERNGSAMNRS